jgi:hypothetical protein
MEKTIKITIEIESELDRNTTSVVRIVDMLFTTSNNLIDADDMLESFKNAVKVSKKNFKGITICVNTSDYGNYQSYRHIKSFRVLNNYGVITACDGNYEGNFHNYQEFDIKHLFKIIKEHVSYVNSQFIIEVKNKQTLA